MRLSPRLGPLFLALLLLAPAAPAQGTPTIEMTVSRDVDGNLAIDLVTRGASEATSLLVTHQDPLTLATVVDWLGSFPVTAGTTTSAILKGVREDVDLRVRLLPAGVAPNRLPNGVYDGAHADTLATRAQASLPAYVNARAVDVASYRVGSGALGNIANYDEVRGLVTRSGVVVVGWHLDNHLWVAHSTDGGRSFSPAARLDNFGLAGPYDWGMGELDSGMVQFVYHPMADASKPWGITRFSPTDGATHAMLQNGTVDIGSTRASVLVVPDGSAILTAARPGGGVQVWRIHDTQLTRRLGDVPFDQPVMTTRAGIMGTQLSVVFLTQWTPVPNRVYYAVSPDSGGNFSAPVPLATPTAEMTGGINDLGEFIVDGAGQQHLALGGFNGQGTPMGVYLLLNPDGTERHATRVLNAVTPSLGVRGSRVWLDWGGNPAGTVERSTGNTVLSTGQTLNQLSGFVPYRGIGVFPDGRPLLIGKKFGDQPSEGFGVAPLFDPTGPASTFLRRTDQPLSEFTIDAFSVPTYASVGERVNVTIGNSYRGSGDADVTLTLVVNGVNQETKTTRISGSAGGSTLTSFLYAPPATGTYAVTVKLSDGQAAQARTLQVSPSPVGTFALRSQYAPPVMYGGEPVEVLANLSYTGPSGSGSASATVTLREHGTPVSEKVITIVTGENPTVRIPYTPPRAGNPSLTLQLHTGQVFSPMNATVIPRYVLHEQTVPANATVGDTITISANLTFQGPRASMETITLRLNGSILTSTPRFLQPGERFSVAFLHNLRGAGAYRFNVELPNGQAFDERTVQVGARAFAPATPRPEYSFGEIRVGARTVVGEPVDVRANVTYQGNVSRSVTYELLVDGVVESRVTLDVQPGWLTDAGFSFVPRRESIVAISVRAPDGSQSPTSFASVRSEYSLHGIAVPPTGTLGRGVNVTGEFTYSGTGTGTAYATLVVNGTTSGSEAFPLAPGQRAQAKAFFSPVYGGTYRVTLQMPNGLRFPEQEVTFTDASAQQTFVFGEVRVLSDVVVGQPVEVRGNITYRGSASRSATYELLVDGVAKFPVTVNVQSGWTTDAGFSFTPQHEGLTTLAIRAPDGTQSAQLAVMARSDYAMRALSVPSVGRLDQGVNVTADFTYGGTLTGTVYATLVINGTTAYSEPFNIAPGQRGQITIPFWPAYAGTYRLTIEMPNGLRYAEQTVTFSDPTSPAPFVFDDLRVPSRIRYGQESANVQVDWRHTQTVAAVHTLEILANDALVYTNTWTLPANSAGGLNFSFSPPAPGTYSIMARSSLGAASPVRALLVEPPAPTPTPTPTPIQPPPTPTPPDLGPLELPPDAQVGVATSIGVTIVSESTVGQVARVEFLVNNNVREARDVTLQPSATVGITFDLTPVTPGSYALTMRIVGGDSSSATLEVAPPTATTPATPTPPPVEPEKRIEIRFDVNEILIPPGGEASIVITIRNVGREPVPLRGISFDGLPPGVAVRLGANAEGEVDAGATRTLSATLVAQPGATLASQRASIAAVDSSGQDAGSATLAVRVADPATLIDQPVTNGDVKTMLYAAGAATTATLGGIWLFLRRDVGRILLGAATLPLYTRLKKSDVLKNEVRASVYAYIQANPGVRFEELRKALGLGNGALVFHLQILEREGFVKSAKEWSKRRFWASANAGGPKSDVTAHDAVANLLAGEPGLSPSAVAQKLGISRQLARYHLKALERQGRVRAEGSGILQQYHLLGRP